MYLLMNCERRPANLIILQRQKSTTRRKDRMRIVRGSHTLLNHVSQIQGCRYRISISTSLLSTILLKYRYRYRRYFDVEVSKAVSTILLQPFFRYFDIDTFLLTLFKLSSYHISNNDVSDRNRKYCKAFYN